MTDLKLLTISGSLRKGSYNRKLLAEAVRAQPFGRIMLGALAIGLVGFAIYCFAEARYRIVPRCASPDTKTLAGRFDNTFERAIARVS